MTADERLEVRLERDRVVREEIDFVSIENRYHEVERLLARILDREGDDIIITPRARTFRKQWKKEEIVQAAKLWFNEHGSPPRGVDWKRRQDADEKYPHPTTVIKHYGTFSAMLKEAGMESLPVVMVRPTTLMCSNCQEWKLDDEFPTSRRKNENKRRGRIYTCRECKNDRAKTLRGAVAAKSTGAKTRPRRRLAERQATA